MCILYKSGLDLHIVDWLSCHKHTEDSSQETAGTVTNIDIISTVVDGPICTSGEDIRAASSENIRTANATDTQHMRLATKQR